MHIKTIVSESYLNPEIWKLHERSHPWKLHTGVDYCTAQPPLSLWWGTMPEGSLLKIWGCQMFQPGVSQNIVLTALPTARKAAILISACLNIQLHVFQFPSIIRHQLQWSRPLATVKIWKLAWLMHVKPHNSLLHTFLQKTLEGGRCRGRQRKCWMDNTKEWTSLPMPELLTRASCRKERTGSLLNHPSCLSDNTVGQGTELNWITVVVVCGLV